MINQAVLLVGGRGERLRPFTDNVPKPMVPANGKPFLEHLVVLLKNNGITDILFLTGYLGETISEYFGDGSRFGVSIDYSVEETPLGTGGALYNAKSKLHDSFFLLFGDSYLPFDYMKMASEFKRCDKLVLLSVYDNRENTDVPFNVKLNKNEGTVAAYLKQRNKDPQFTHCDAGVIVVSSSVVGLIGNKLPISFEEAVYPRLIQIGELGYYVSEERFYDIGTLERLRDFEKYLMRG